MRRAELVSGIAMLLFGLALIFWLIPEQSVHVRGASMQPGVYPLISAWAIVGFSLLLVFQDLLFPARQGRPAASPVNLASLVHLVFVVSVLLATLLVFEYLGFIPGGVLLVVILMVYMGARNPAMIAGVALGATVAIWLFFDKLLDRPLP